MLKAFSEISLVVLEIDRS